MTYWGAQIEALQPAYDVIAFDLPGHGASPGKPEDWTFDHAASTVASLIEGLGCGPVHVVGLSVGGMVAQTLTLAHPALVYSLVLIGTAATFSGSARAAMRARAELVLKGGMAAVLPSTLERWFTAATKARRPDLIDRVTKTLLGDDPTVHAAMWTMIAGFDVLERLGKIQCPTLILAGESDLSTPPEAAAALAAGISGAKLIVLADASHMAPLEVPEAINAEILAFLKVASRA